MTKSVVAFAAFVLLIAPLAQAHTSPVPLNVDQHLITDDTNDAYAAYDGFDLQDLYVRESFVDGQEGVTFRMVVYGGFGPAKIASQMHIDMDITTPAGAPTFRISSADGLTWDGHGQIVDAGVTMDETGVVSGTIQWFIPLADIGVMHNETIGPFVWKNYADDDLRDIAPGGMPIPGTNGATVAPGTSTVHQATITLEGAVGYTETAMTRVGTNVNLTVENLITPIGQHIMLAIPDAPGWTIDFIDTNAKAVDVGQDPFFEFLASSTSSDEAFDIEILTDLGGREIITIYPAHHPAANVTSAETEPVDGEDTPAGLWVAPLALAAVAILRRK